MTKKLASLALIAGFTLSLKGALQAAPEAAIAVSPAPGAVRVFPNPWKSNVHASLPVTFDSLPPNATIKIFTVSGRIVKTLEASSGSTTWDRTNDGGDKVASGIYLYSITDVLGNETSGKLAIVK
jgi:hypothetical protein